MLTPFAVAYLPEDIYWKHIHPLGVKQVIFSCTFYEKPGGRADYYLATTYSTTLHRHSLSLHHHPNLSIPISHQHHNFTNCGQHLDVSHRVTNVNASNFKRPCGPAFRPLPPASVRPFPERCPLNIFTSKQRATTTTTTTTTMPKVFGKTMLSMLALKLAAAADTASPNEPIPKPECDATTPVAIRYSSTSQRLYLESADGTTRGGCVTLNDIWTERGGKAPLYAVDAVTGAISANATGTWLLTEELYIEDGITLQVHGSAAGGDADELRLLSTKDYFLNLRAHGGNLDFLSTKVFSYDNSTNTYDEDETDGRSYISAVSEVIYDADLDCAGMAKTEMGEARMDIEDTEIGYLGYHDSESYGLTWKVRGFCTDKSNEEVFEEVNVYGNIYDSDIHHMNFGVYTYGHQQGDWRRNLMHDNSGYGFDPHDDSDFLTIHDNTVYDNGYHGIIASKRCNGVSIQGNEVYGGAETSAGIFLHRSSDDAIVKDNYVHDNGDAGLAMLECFNADVSGNVFENNKYGVRFSVGCADNVFSGNTFKNSYKYNTYSYLGSDLPDVVESGRSQDNIFRDNIISGGLESIKLKESDGIQFIDNAFDNVTTIRFDDVGNTLMSGNTGLEDVSLKVDNDACFDAESDDGYEPKC